MTSVDAVKVQLELDRNVQSIFGLHRGQFAGKHCSVREWIQPTAPKKLKNYSHRKPERDAGQTVCYMALGFDYCHRSGLSGDGCGGILVLSA